jgi:anti-sigma factor RsiW
MKQDDKLPANPEELRLLLQALVDGELDAATALEIERRVAGDPALAAEHARIAALSAAVRRLPRPEVSEAFQARIAAIGEEVTIALPPTTRHVTARQASSFDWRAMAASIMVTAVLASGGTWWVMRPAPSSFADAVADAHRRSLLAASPVDVASSDRHSVKPWLDGRIGVSPPTVDLSAEGFKLIGGRVEVVDDIPLPALVYRYNEHLITLVAAPRGSEVGIVTPAPADLSAGGFSVVHWTDDAFSYWAVSDTERHVLDDFGSRFRKAIVKE